MPAPAVGFLYFDSCCQYMVHLGKFCMSSFDDSVLLIKEQNKFDPRQANKPLKDAVLIQIRFFFIFFIFSAIDFSRKWQ